MNFWKITTDGYGLVLIMVFIFMISKSKLLQHIGKKEGMPSNVVCGLEKDAQGNIWCSTYKGICRIEQESHRVTT